MSLLLSTPSHAAEPPAPSDGVYLFTSFEEPADAGLKFLWSEDALHWERVPGVFLKPRVGGGLMRDPSLLRGPDGVYHLVWTTSWRGAQGIGYSHSEDMVHWAPQRLLPLMAHEPTTVNLWAPELYYDAPRKRFVVAWASTLPGRFPDGEEERENNHRMYCATTQDFQSFTPTEVFCEPGFSVIDAVTVPVDQRFALVLKDNTRPVRALRVAWGDSPTGPWGPAGEPFTPHLTEGPSVARVGDEWIVYYDQYGDKSYGAVATKDFKAFRQLEGEVQFPSGHKHGTVLRATRKELEYLQRVGREQVMGKRLPWVPHVDRATLDARLADVDRVAARGPFTPDWESLKGFKTPGWYQDAKFGLFIHWGPYSVPAYFSEWYPRYMYQPGHEARAHHEKTYGPLSEFGYKDFIPRFKAEKYDPAAWADLFRKSGARYVIPVAEHHDGFPMYDSDYTEWSAAKQGPKRDVLGELAGALAKEGIVFGASSHRAEHWWFFDQGMLSPSDVQDPANASLYGPASNKRVADSHAEPPDKDFLDDWLLRCCELVDKHHPKVVYFDWWINQPEFQPYLKRFGAYYYNRAAERGEQVAINFKSWEGRSFPDGTGVFDIERGLAGDIRPDFWQTCTSVSRSSWGYVENHDYKPSGELIDDLVDVVSKNGAMLLNIGPKADGTIPEPERQMLLEIGAWLRVNGEAVYGTRPWRRYGEGPTHIDAGSFTDAKRPEFTGRDFRFTQKGNAVYAIGLAWPGSSHARIGSLGSGAGRIADVRLLGYDGVLRWRQGEAGLDVELPAKAPSPAAYVLNATIPPVE